MPVERETFTKTEVRAGVMVVLSGLLLAVFIAAILNMRPPGETKSFVVGMPSAAGLGVGGDVRFGGVVAGRVTDISPDGEDRSQMLVHARVDASTPVNTASTAYVTQVTLTSEMHLEITTGSGDAPLLEDGGRIPNAPGGLFGDLPEMTASVNRLLVDVSTLIGVSDSDGDEVLSDTHGRTLAEMFTTLDGLMSDMRLLLGVVDEDGNVVLADDHRTLAEIMTSIDGAVGEGTAALEDMRDVLSENRDAIRELLDTAGDAAESADALVAELKELVSDNRETFDATLGGTREAVERVDDLMVEMKTLVESLQEVLDRNGPSFDETLDTLNRTLRNLEEVSRTLADQPQALIRGRQPVGRP